MTERGAASGIVGRAREQAILSGLLDDAIGGNGKLALLSGEAGIGKSTLATTLLAEAVARGAVALIGGCYDLTITPPYGPWLECVRSYQRSNDLPAVPEDLGDGAALSRFESQAAHFESVFGFLASIAAVRPLIVLLEDLHWADPASLDLLRFVARRISSSRILILATHRSDEVSRHHPLYRLLPLLTRESGAARLNLRRLDSSSTREMIASEYPVPATDIERLVGFLDRHAEGNPLFIGELLRALIDDGILLPDDDHWRLGDLQRARIPEFVRQIIEHRLERLSEVDRHFLETAAVIGQELSLDLWLKVCDADEDSLAAALARAIDARVIEETKNGNGLRFVHALIRDTLYHGLVSPRRRERHRSIAAALIASNVSDTDAVAHHLMRGGDERACDWLILAGDRAERQFAWSVAVERFEQAIEILESDPSRAREHGWLSYRIASLLRFTEPSRALQYWTDAERQGRATGDDVLTLMSRYSLGYVRRHLGGFQQSSRVTTEVARQIDQRIRAGALRDWQPPAEWVFSVAPSFDLYGDAIDPVSLPDEQPIWLGWGETLVYRAACEPPDEIAALVEPLLDLWPYTPSTLDKVHDVYDRMCWGDALGARGQIAMAQSRPDDALRAFQARHELSVSSGYGAGAIFADAFALMTLTLFRPEQRDAQRLLLARAANWAERDADITSGEALALGELTLLFLDGHWEKARSLALQALHDSQAATFRQLLIEQLLTLLYYSGDDHQAQRLASEALPDGAATAFGTVVLLTALQALWTQASIALDGGDLAGASTWIAAYDRWMEWSGVTLKEPDRLLLHARMYRARGEFLDARKHAEQALAVASRPVLPLQIIAARRFLGELATEAGEYDVAATQLGAALALAETSQAPFEVALAQLATATLHAALGQRQHAMKALGESRDTLERLGATPALERADALRRRLEQQEGAETFPAGLSTREVDVLRLVAEGITDAEVAERLFVSRRTVTTHLTSIYTKLGVSSRAAATRFAFENDLV